LLLLQLVVALLNGGALGLVAVIEGVAVDRPGFGPRRFAGEYTQPKSSRGMAPSRGLQKSKQKNQNIRVLYWHRTTRKTIIRYSYTHRIINRLFFIYLVTQLLHGRFPSHLVFRERQRSQLAQRTTGVCCALAFFIVKVVCCCISMVLLVGSSLSCFQRILLIV